MNYEEWRDELFGPPAEIDPVLFDHRPEFYDVPSDLAFEYVDRMLFDSDVHAMFDKDQLGNGIHTVYSNDCSDLPFLYTTECAEARRIEGIRNLTNLYANYFERYCTGPVVRIGYDQTDGPMGYICHMFWDGFVVYPGNATPGMVAAAIEVMRQALESRNDNCLTSAIHGLGHWASDVPAAVAALEGWLSRPTTRNRAVLEYAEMATSGMIQ